MQEEIQKEDKWILHKLSGLAIQNRLTICFLVTKRSNFCIKL